MIKKMIMLMITRIKISVFKKNDDDKKDNDDNDH